MCKVFFQTERIPIEKHRWDTDQTTFDQIQTELLLRVEHVLDPTFAHFLYPNVEDQKFQTTDVHPIHFWKSDGGIPKS